MGLLSGITGAVGVGLQAWGEYKKGQDAKKAYNYNREVARLQAEYIKQAAKIEIAQLARATHQFVSRQRAIQGKSGTVSGSGSNVDVVNQIYNRAEIDAAIIRWRAKKMYEIAKKGANIFGMQANQFEYAGNLNAATTLLGGLSKFDWRHAPSAASRSSSSHSGP